MYKLLIEMYDVDVMGRVSILFINVDTMLHIESSLRFAVLITGLCHWIIHGWLGPSVTLMADCDY